MLSVTSRERLPRPPQPGATWLRTHLLSLQPRHPWLPLEEKQWALGLVHHDRARGPSPTSGSLGGAGLDTVGSAPPTPTELGSLTGFPPGPSLPGTPELPCGQKKG